jgi:hypothetical protein
MAATNGYPGSESDIVTAARIIADAIHHLAESVEMQARVQAGEYEGGEEPDVERYMDGTPVRGTL